MQIKNNIIIKQFKINCPLAQSVEHSAVQLGDALSKQSSGLFVAKAERKMCLRSVSVVSATDG